MLAYSGSQLDQVSTIALALGCAILVILAFHRSPRFATLSWVVVLCFVPYWFSVAIVLPFTPATIAGGFILLALFPIHSFKLTKPDLVVAAFAAIYAISFLFGAGTVSSAWVMISHWLLGYALGRVILLRVGVEQVFRSFAYIFTAVSVLAVFEFVSGWNPFVLLAVPGRLYNTWGSLLERGGVLRAEGAFGHPIALGASIALVIPLVLATRMRSWIRLAMVAVMLVAVVTTFSRTAMVCSVISVILSLTLTRDSMGRPVRVGAILTILAVGVVLTPFVQSVFDAAGDEATGSAAYRGDLFALLESTSLIGLSSAFRQTATGSNYIDNFGSIDNQVVLIGLLYGLIPLICVAILIIGACVIVLTGRGTAPVISIVAQIPAFFTVALITQYGMFVWVVGGLAVTCQALFGISSGDQRSGEYAAGFEPPIWQVDRSARDRSSP